MAYPRGEWAGVRTPPLFKMTVLESFPKKDPVYFDVWKGSSPFSESLEGAVLKNFLGTPPPDLPLFQCCVRPLSLHHRQMLFEYPLSSPIALSFQSISLSKSSVSSNVSIFSNTAPFLQRDVRGFTPTPRQMFCRQITKFGFLPATIFYLFAFLEQEKTN